MGGFIGKALAGLGKGMQSYGQTGVASEIMRMRDERLQGYATAGTAGKQAFQTSERIAGQEFRSAESEATRASAERVSSAKAARTAPTVKDFITGTDPLTGEEIKETRIFNPATRGWDPYQPTSSGGQALIPRDESDAKKLIDADLDSVNIQFGPDFLASGESEKQALGGLTKDQYKLKGIEFYKNGGEAGTFNSSLGIGAPQQGAAKIGDKRTIKGRTYVLTEDGPVEVAGEQKPTAKPGLIGQERAAPERKVEGSGRGTPPKEAADFAVQEYMKTLADIDKNGLPVDKVTKSVTGGKDTVVPAGKLKKTADALRKVKAAIRHLRGKKKQKAIKLRNKLQALVDKA